MPNELFSQDRQKILADQTQAVFSHRLDGLIFDCDGVLVNSKKANIAWYNRVLAEFGHPPMPVAHEDYVQMATVRQALESILTPAEMVQMPEMARRIPYSTFSLPLLKLEPGMRELLEWLRQKKIALAVHTNRSDGIWDVLDFFSLRDFFDPVMTAELAEPKPSPDGVLKILALWQADCKNVGFVGDSTTDSGAAQGANVPFIAYKNPRLEATLHIDNFVDFQNALNLWL